MKSQLSKASTSALQLGTFLSLVLALSLVGARGAGDGFESWIASYLFGGLALTLLISVVLAVIAVFRTELQTIAARAVWLISLSGVLLISSILFNIKSDARHQQNENPEHSESFFTDDAGTLLSDDIGCLRIGEADDAGKMADCGAAGNPITMLHAAENAEKQATTYSAVVKGVTEE